MSELFWHATRDARLVSGWVDGDSIVFDRRIVRRPGERKRRMFPYIIVCFSVSEKSKSYRLEFRRIGLKWYCVTASLALREMRCHCLHEEGDYCVVDGLRDLKAKMGAHIASCEDMLRHSIDVRTDYFALLKELVATSGGVDKYI